MEEGKGTQSGPYGNADEGRLLIAGEREVFEEERNVSRGRL